MVEKSISDEKADKAAEQIEKTVQKVQDAANEAVKRISTALDKIADTAGDGVEQGTEKLGKVTKKAVNIAEAAGERGREAVDDLVEQAGDYAGNARTFVQENPGQSIVIALAVGWIIGRLIRR